MNLPNELKYSEEHEWVKSEGDNRVRIGITDFAPVGIGGYRVCGAAGGGRRSDGGGTLRQC